MKSLKNFVARSIVILGAIALAAAAAPVPPEVIARFETMLKDPRSAQIEITKTTVNLVQGVSETVVCGRYNSKNSYGGYVGFKDFVYRPIRGGTIYSDGLVARGDGSTDDINDIISQTPADSADLDRLSKRAEVIFADVREAFALCASST